MASQYDAIDRRLLEEFQHHFPLVPRPYAALADRLGIDEAEVLTRLDRLREIGTVSRVGAVVRANSAGSSTLAAMAVPPDHLDQVADLVSGFAQVNHNYQRDHRLNLWFVVAADSRDAVLDVLRQIERLSGIKVLDLPMVKDFHIDLGFSLQWT